jgi:Tfp pilus assembly protein PilF
MMSVIMKVQSMGSRLKSACADASKFSIVLIVLAAGCSETVPIERCISASNYQTSVLECSAILTSSRTQLPASDRARAFYARAHAYRMSQQEDKAMADYDEAIKLVPTMTKALNGRGLILQHRGDCPAAMKDYDAAIKADAQYADPMTNKAYCLMTMRKFDDALTLLDTAIKLDPAYLVAYTYRAMIYEERGDTARAEMDRERVRLPLFRN